MGGGAPAALSRKETSNSRGTPPVRFARGHPTGKIGWDETRATASHTHDRMGQAASYTKRFLILKTSGNEVYYTASSLLVVLKNFCSKLH